MAFNDPANQPASPDQPAPVQQSDDLSSRWSDWIGKPGNRAAMMQFGVAMLQPMMPGENVLSRFGSSIGQAGEAEARSHQLDVSDEMARNKQELMGSQAQLAESRAQTAGAGAGIRELMARNAEERLKTQQEQGGFGRQLQAAKEYEQAKVLNPEIEPFEEWSAKYGLGIGARPQATTPVKPTTEQLLRSPEYSKRFKELEAVSRKDPNKAREVIRALESRVSDPDALYEKYGLKR